MEGAGVKLRKTMLLIPDGDGHWYDAVAYVREGSGLAIVRHPWGGTFSVTHVPSGAALYIGRRSSCDEVLRLCLASGVDWTQPARVVGNDRRALRVCNAARRAVGAYRGRLMDSIPGSREWWERAERNKPT
jgi:hypothetical protein